MSLATLAQALAAGDRILLDSTSLIAYLDGSESVTPVAQHIIDEFVRDGRNLATVSMVTAMELLGRPRRQVMPTGYTHVHDFLARLPHLRAEVIDLPVAQEAAALRTSYGFRPPDALIIGTGIVHQVRHLVTNDTEWRQKLQRIQARVAVCLLRDHLPFP